MDKMLYSLKTVGKYVYFFKKNYFNLFYISSNPFYISRTYPEKKAYNKELLCQYRTQKELLITKCNLKVFKLQGLVHLSSMLRKG